MDNRGQLVRGELGTHLRAMGWEGTSRSWTKTCSNGIRMSHTWRTCMAGMEKCGARYLRTSTMSAIHRMVANGRQARVKFKPMLAKNAFSIEN